MVVEGNILRSFINMAELPVTLEDIDVNGIKGSGKKQLFRQTEINKYLGHCVDVCYEFPDLVIIDRMYRGRKFEFITISADKGSKSRMCSIF